MSQATKRKHVVKEVMEDFVVPSEQQQIVRVLGTPGNNLHEVETGDGKKFLVSMPTKFRKNIWIKRGDFLIVDPIEEGEKVKAEIAFILYKDHVRYLKKEGCWPEMFSIDSSEGAAGDKDGDTSQDGKASPIIESSASEEEVEDYSDLFVNTNRAHYEYSGSDTSEEQSEEEKEK
ncbi:probable RNA-binding protein EIF1AD isoform X2 [Ambystoma mexicanum]|uniref:probable RNA-binding protein EIF1AD isoform X2 n=1 Tax=Ambystoma mexicanum TaxID=8296 RepID=UPI0037E93002